MENALNITIGASGNVKYFVLPTKIQTLKAKIQTVQ